MSYEVRTTFEFCFSSMTIIDIFNGVKIRKIFKSNFQKSMQPVLIVSLLMLYDWIIFFRRLIWPKIIYQFTDEVLIEFSPSLFKCENYSQTGLVYLLSITRPYRVKDHKSYTNLNNTQLYSPTVLIIECLNSQSTLKWIHAIFQSSLWIFFTTRDMTSDEWHIKWTGYSLSSWISCYNYIICINHLGN